MSPLDRCPHLASHSERSGNYVEQMNAESLGQRKFLFLDRDGVINQDVEGYVKNLGEFRFIDGAIEALVRAHETEWIVNVCTIQPAIGKGIMSHSDLDEIHQFLRRTVENAGGMIGEIYYCPHLYAVGCEYRKRNPGQLFDLSRKFSISDCERRNAWLIGDNLRDLDAGHAFGCNVGLVTTGFGTTLIAEKKVPQFAHVFNDLAHAVEYLTESH